MYSFAILLKYFLKENKFQSSGRFMMKMNSDFVLYQISLLDTCILYRINYLKYTKNIHSQFFHYLLFYMKPDMININISGITDLHYRTIHFNGRKCKSEWCNITVSNVILNGQKMQNILVFLSISLLSILNNYLCLRLPPNKDHPGNKGHILITLHWLNKKKATSE